MRPAISLAHLLEQPRPPDALLAWRHEPGGGDREVHWRDFVAAVANLRARLAPLPTGRVALYTADAYAFAVGLFGIWHAGRLAVCPPNGQPDALAGLSQLVIAAVSDAPTPVPGRPLLPADLGWPASGDLGWPASGDAGSLSPVASLEPLALAQPALALFTSGTTGRGKAVEKRLLHLDREVQALAAQLGERVGDAPVFGSASHQHLYGMLFRVLWPLATGRPFHARGLLHAEELVPRMRTRAPCVLASVPAHLKRLAQRGEFEALARTCRVVFSSGGPLDEDTARRWASAQGEAPIEIFGSTETGGVAWRRQSRAGAAEPWTPFAGIDVARDPDTRLRVHSPLTSVGDERSGFAMGDRIEPLADGRFRVLGRADRVLKIGEKRLALPDMEERLREHPLVEVAALLPLDHAGEQRVAAAVVLTASGRVALEATGARELSSVLREALAGEWDRVLLPRSFRFVPALPEDAQGKVTLPLLTRLFSGAAP